MTRAIAKAIAALAVAAAVLLGATDSCTSQEPPKPSELAAKIGELTKAKKWDEAIALVKSKAAQESPGDEVRNVMYGLATTLFFNDKLDESLELHKQVIERFPESRLTPFAWCGLARIYGYRRDNDRVIAALEQAISYVPKPNEPSIHSSNVTHTFAYEVLATHYVRTQQWEKGLKTLLGWQPSSGCGTCDAEMVTSRDSSILLCLVRLGRFHEASDRAWRELARGSQGGRELGPFLLIRLYDESGQLGDLGRMNAELVAMASKQFPLDEKNSQNYVRLQSVVNASASLSRAIGLARSNDWEQHIDAIAAVQGPKTLDDYIAHWILTREHKQSVPSMVRAAQRHESKNAQLIELLGSIDSQAARDSLVRLAADGNVYMQQYVCGVIRHRMSDPKPLIEQIVARVPGDRSGATNWNVGPAPFRFQFFAPSTRPDRGSLPTSLPADLFAENKQ